MYKERYMLYDTFPKYTRIHVIAPDFKNGRYKYDVPAGYNGLLPFR
jgi:hypothetical protein